MTRGHSADGFKRATLHELPKFDWHHLGLMCRVFVAEALGLGMICFIIVVHGAEERLSSPVSGPVAASAAFAIAVWTVGPVSGPQITPILTLAYLLTRRMNFVYCILGFAGQVAGALIAVFLGSRLVPGLWEKSGLNLHIPGPGVTDAQAFGMEFVCSFLLIICCLSTLDEFRKEHWSQGHVTVFSLVVFLLILMLAAVLVKTTGCGMNPSASLAGAIYNLNFAKLWIYFIAPITGSVFAVALWELMLSDGASWERTKHWISDRNFDRTKDYKMIKWEKEHRFENISNISSQRFLVKKCYTYRF